MVTKTKYPGICNNCGRLSEFYIHCGNHTLQLCCSCAMSLGNELTKQATENRSRPFLGVSNDSNLSQL